LILGTLEFGSIFDPLIYLLRETDSNYAQKLLKGRSFPIIMHLLLYISLFFCLHLHISSLAIPTSHHTSYMMFGQFFLRKVYNMAGGPKITDARLRLDQTSQAY
jgi:hypothetical protein